MATMRVIKRKIKSVTSTQQITKAMNLVAASKLQKAKQKLTSIRPFFVETQRVIQNIVGSSVGIKHVFLEKREVKNILLILVTGDKGLCGGYNANACKEAHNLIKSKPDSNSSLIVIGNKGRDYFTRRHVPINKTFTGISESAPYEKAADIGQIAIDQFLSGEVDEVYVVYTEFKSTLSHHPKAVRLLPVDISRFEKKAVDSSEVGKPKTMMVYEPDEETVLDYVIPRYVKTSVFGSMVESAACELGARMTSMDSATDNAEEMISKYTLQYNRARQGAITQEITEIVSGANALE